MALHSLALQLGKTVTELSHQLTLEEFNNWFRYFEQRNKKPDPEPADAAFFMEAFK